MSEERDTYPKKTIFWNEFKERSLYSDRQKNHSPKQTSLGSIHKRLGKKIIPSNDDDEMSNGHFPVQEVKHETFERNPFRSTGRPLRSVAACPASESNASQSMDEKDTYPTLKVKVELPTSPMPSCSRDGLKRKRDYHPDESETQAESDDEVVEVPSKKQKIDSISIDLGKHRLPNKLFKCCLTQGSNFIF